MKNMQCPPFVLVPEGHGGHHVITYASPNYHNGGDILKSEKRHRESAIK